MSRIINRIHLLPFVLAGFVFILLICCNNPGKEKTGIAEKFPIYYELTGKGNTTLVFVHGWCINSDYWKQQVNVLKDSFQVLTLDLRGHGKSDTAALMTIEQYADDIVTLVNKLNLDSIILIGHSMSGNINLHVYNKIPGKVRGFIGIDNLQEVGHEPSAEEAEQLKAFFTAFRNDYKNMARQYTNQYLFPPTADSAVKERVIQDIATANPGFAISTLESLAGEYKAEQQLLPKMKVPVLLIVAENSLKDESSVKKYCGSGYRYWIIKNSGHYPMIEQPDRFNFLLKEAIAVANAR